jgi:thiol-disulfide isomerase/thioredoxin
VPELPRFSWRVLLASTTVALVAATATYVVLDDGGDAPKDPSEAANIELTPDGPSQPLDEVAFTEFGGTKVALASLKGTPVILNFFASYCTPCITEMPALEQVHQELGAKAIVLGLAVTDRKDDAQKMVRRTKVTYRTAQDKDGSVLSTLDGTILPTTVLLDADGKVVASHAGEVTAKELLALVHDKLGVDP